MNLLVKELYLEMLIRKIELNKELFILDMEQGCEVLIPKFISMEDLPMSFKFYYSSIHIIQDNFDIEKKLYF